MVSLSRLIAVFVATATLGLTAEAASEVHLRTVAEQTGFSEAGLRRLDDYIKTEIAEKKIPGAVTIVYRNGKTAYTSSLGVRDPAVMDPMTADAIFRIYSMSKPITTVAAMMLVEEGKLRLDEPVSKFIPSFSSLKVGVEKTEDGALVLRTQPAERQITIQDLMRHTSGLTYGFFGQGLVKKAYLDANLNDAEIDNAEFAERVAKLPLAYQPGSTWDYGHSTDVLGRVIEIVSGMSLYQFEKERLLDPLGMKDTSFYVSDPSKNGRVAEPFANDRSIGKDVVMNDPRVAQKWESGGGGMVSTASDYARFALMVLNGGKLDGRRYLSSKTIAYMGSNHIGPGSGVTPGKNYVPGPGFGFGLGFAVRTEAGVNPAEGSIGEMSWFGAGGTNFWIDPSENMLVVCMTQAAAQRGRLRIALKNVVYGALDR